MRSVGWKTYFLIFLAVLCALLAFWRCYSGRFQPVTPIMLINSGLSVPYAAEQDLLSVTRCCLVHSASWLEQLVFYGMHHDDALPDSRGIYLVYAIGAALACLMAFRVGSSCVNIYVGLGTAFLLACMPLQYWANCAFTAALVLFNWDRLLSALKFNTYLTWTLYFLSTIMMLFNCFFTETVLLQWWFGGQLAVLILRYLMIPTYHRSPHYLASDVKPRVFVRGEGSLRDVYVCLGVIITAWVVITILTLMISSFLAQNNLRISSFFKIILWTSIIVLVLSLVYIFMPNHSDLKEKFAKFFKRMTIRIFDQNPETTFFHLRIAQLGLALVVYALAIIAFGPFVLKIYGMQMRFFVSAGLEAFLTFAENLSWLEKYSPCAPFVCALLTFVLYKLGKLRSQDSCGIMSICCFAMLFLPQQRYAAISAPFFAISVLSFPYILLRLAFGYPSHEKQEVANA